MITIMWDKLGQSKNQGRKEVMTRKEGHKILYKTSDLAARILVAKNK